jgi:hypothetical protein
LEAASLESENEIRHAAEQVFMGKENSKQVFMRKENSKNKKGERRCH